MCSQRLGKVKEDEDETRWQNVNSMQESDYSTEENKRKLIRESFKIDENDIWKQDKKRRSNQNVPERLFGSGVASKTLLKNKCLRICNP